MSVTASARGTAPAKSFAVLAGAAAETLAFFEAIFHNVLDCSWVGGGEGYSEEDRNNEVGSLHGWINEESSEVLNDIEMRFLGGCRTELSGS